MNIKYFPLLIVIIYALGVGSGVFIEKKFIFNKNNASDINGSGWDTTQKRLLESGAFQGFSNEVKIKTITGIVEEIKGNVIKIKSKLLTPVLGPELDERYIEVNEDTKIIMVIKKSDEQYQKEMKEATEDGGYKKNPNSPAGGISMYSSEEVPLDQIKEGKLITIKTNEDVKDKKFIAGSEIYFEK